MTLMPTKQNSPLFEELEPRLLFSADVAEPLAIEALQEQLSEEPAVTANLEFEEEANEVAIEQPVEPETATSMTNEEEIPAEPQEETTDDTGSEQPAAEETIPVTDIAAASTEETAGTALSESSVRNELVFINDNVSDYEQLVADIEQNADQESSIEVILLDSEENGIEQISAVLAEHLDLEAVHLITHGSNGSLALGSSWLDSDDLAGNSDAITAWSDALSAEADILLYGCDIAADENGRNLTDTLAELTGADVAASDDKTGHLSLSGDWELEYINGNIETELAVSESGQQEWEGLLATNTIADDFSSGDFTGDTGSVSWSGDWITTGTAVVSGGELRLDLAGTSAARQADLSAAVSASLSFDYRTEKGGVIDTPPDSIVVEISSDGGGAWTSLGNIKNSKEAFAGSKSGSKSYDISSYATATTQIRFRVDAGYSSGTEFVYFDNVVISYSNINTPPTINGGDTVSTTIDENTTLVTTLVVTDPDAGDTMTFSINGGIDYSLFSIDSNSGALSFSPAPDYENPTDDNGDNIYEVQVAVSDGNGGVDTQDFTITVNDINEFAVSAVSDSNGAANTVSDGAAVGTTVGITALATDDDGSDSVTYSLTDDAGGLFSINPNTGVITVANALDSDSAASHVLTVRAASSDGSFSEADFTVQVSDSDDTEGGGSTDTGSTVADDGIADETETEAGEPPVAEDGLNIEDEDAGSDDPDGIEVADFEYNPPESQEYSDENSQGDKETALSAATPPLELSPASEPDPDSSRTADTAEQIQARNLSELLRKGVKVAAAETMDFISPPVSAAPIDLETFTPGGLALDHENMHAQLSAMRQDMDQTFEESEKGHKAVLYMVSGISASFAAGIASYLLRAGSLLSSFLATVPLWKGFDPISILLVPGKKRKKRKEDKISRAEAASDQKAEDMFAGKEKDQ